MPYKVSCVRIRTEVHTVPYRRRRMSTSAEGFIDEGVEPAPEEEKDPAADVDSDDEAFSHEIAFVKRALLNPSLLSPL